MNRAILHIKKWFISMFIVVIVFVCWQIFANPKISSLQEKYGNPYQRRQRRLIWRGFIYDRNMTPLALNDDANRRIYPLGRACAHLVGHVGQESSGLEADFDEYLLGLSLDSEIEKKEYTKNMFYRAKRLGNSLVLTIDARLQKAARRALEGKCGAVVVIENGTGEILCLASSPTFDPNNLTKEHPQADQSPFFFRALKGRYAPGSVFKVISYAALLNENKVTLQTQFFSDGKHRIGNYTLHNYHRRAHGWISVETAFAKSCNDTASTLVYENLTKQKLVEYAEKFGFNQKIELIESEGEEKMMKIRRGQIDLKRSYIRQASGINEGEFAQLAVGQGPIMLTPLHAAWIASIIANHGISIQPFFIKKKISGSGKVIKEYKSPNVKRVIPSTTAQTLAQMMRSAVREGTARRVALENIQIAGKTGTAQTASEDKYHAWFIAFTDKISVAVVLENVDATGGEVSAPIAKTIILESIGGKNDQEQKTVRIRTDKNSNQHSSTGTAHSVSGG